MSWIADIIAMEPESVDTLADALASLPDAELMRFAVAAHNLRHAAMAALGRRPESVWLELDRYWRRRYSVAAFRFTETIVGGVIPQRISQSSNKLAKEFSEEEW
jgi:hypothetical protein